MSALGLGRMRATRKRRDRLSFGRNEDAPFKILWTRLLFCTGEPSFRRSCLHTAGYRKHLIGAGPGTNLPAPSQVGLQDLRKFVGLAAALDCGVAMIAKPDLD